ncbi:Ank2 [Symbiodinium sp. KB8]|nr:Ank2 [Symbiodinium sp. KB8]
MQSLCRKSQIPIFMADGGTSADPPAAEAAKREDSQEQCEPTPEPVQLAEPGVKVSKDEESEQPEKLAEAPSESLAKEEASQKKPENLPKDELPDKQTAKVQSQRKGPNLLAELGLKVTTKGVLLPESRKTLLRRRRENRELALANGQAPQVLCLSAAAKRKARNRAERKPPGVLLDDVESELFYGAHQGSVASCTKAVAKGADVNVRTKADLDGVGTGASALHVAAVRGHEDVVAALLHAGSDPLAQTGRGETPVQLATRMGHVEVVKVLRSSGGTPTHVEGVSQLLTKAPPSWRDAQRKKLRKALDNESKWAAASGADRLALEPSPHSGQPQNGDARLAQPRGGDKGDKGGKGKKRQRSRKGKGKGKDDARGLQER